MQIDPLNDALIKMYNAEQAGKFNVELTPASKLLGNVLEIMQKSGYVGNIERTEDGRGGSYTVELRGAINRCGTVKPCLLYTSPSPRDRTRSRMPSSA